MTVNWFCIFGDQCIATGNLRGDKDGKKETAEFAEKSNAALICP